MAARPTPESTRRDEVPGRPVVLSDGLTWCLALPTRRDRPRFERAADEFGREAVSTLVVSEVGHPPEIRRAAETLRENCRRPGSREAVGDFLALASALLRRAHELDPAQALALLSVPTRAIPALVAAVEAAVSGRDLLESGGESR